MVASSRLGKTRRPAGVKERAAWAKRVLDGLNALGAVESDGYLGYPVSIETQAGTLYIHADLEYGAIMQMFKYPARGADLIGPHRVNKISGKWNFHFGFRPTLNDADMYLMQLEQILK